MKKIIISLISVILISILVFGLSSGNDDSTSIRERTVNRYERYPYIVKGPIQDRPLSSLIESFESTTFPPSGWIKINVAQGATGWERHVLGETPIPGFQNGVITVPPGGGSAVAFCNYLTGGTNSNDQWLITPQLTNMSSTDSLIFWLRKYGEYLDHMDIKISTTTPTPSAMTITVALLTFQPADSGWFRYKYRIGNLVPSSSNIYIGFRQWVINTSSDGTSFSLDLVQVTEPNGIRNINFETPTYYKLSQNYPNPFNPTTTISYEIPKNDFVNITVYNSIGQVVKVLVNEHNATGSYNLTFNAANLPSGIYFYKMKSGDFIKILKMCLIK
jgi:hypothetical protein